MAFPDYEPSIPEFIRTRVEWFGNRPLILLGDERITYAEASERSAQDYMRLARHQTKLPLNSAAAADLTIRAAIGELIERKPDPVTHWRVIGSWRLPGDVFFIDDDDTVDGFDFVSHLWQRDFDARPDISDIWTLGPDEEGEWRAWKQPIRADHVRPIIADITPQLWDLGSGKVFFYTVPPQVLTALIPHIGGSAP